MPSVSGNQRFCLQYGFLTSALPCDRAPFDRPRSASARHPKSTSVGLRVEDLLFCAIVCLPRSEPGLGMRLPGDGKARMRNGRLHGDVPTRPWRARRSHKLQYATLMHGRPTVLFAASRTSQLSVSLHHNVAIGNSAKDCSRICSAAVWENNNPLQPRCPFAWAGPCLRDLECMTTPAHPASWRLIGRASLHPLRNEFSQAGRSVFCLYSRPLCEIIFVEKRGPVSFLKVGC